MNLFDLFATLSLDDSDYTKGMDQAEDRAKKSTLGDKLSKVAGVATAALTAASGAVLTFSKSAIDVGQQFDKSISQVAATMSERAKDMVEYNGKTVTSIEALRDFAQQMGRTTAFSATEVAQALNYMALAGYDATTSMGMLPNVLNLAASGGMDLARASDMVTDAASALGLTMEDGSVDIQKTTEMVNQMAKAAASSNTSVEQLGDAMLTIGATAQTMAGGTDRLSTILGLLADNGIKGSEAGTHLRNMLLKLSAPTAEGADALRLLGVSVFDAQGKMRDFEDIFNDLNTSFGNVTPIIEKAYKDLSALSEKDIAKMFKKGDDQLTQFGISMVDAEGNLRSLDDVLTEAGEKFADNASTDQYKIGMLSDIFNARDIAAVNALLNTTTNRWTELSEEIEDSNEAADVMARTQLGNLAGDITLFKSAMEGAKIILSDKLTPGIREFVKFGSRAISDMASAFESGGLSGAMEEFGKYLSEGLSMIIEEAPGLVEAGANLLGALGQGMIENLPVLAESFLSILQMLGGKIVEYLPEFGTTLTQVISEIALMLTNPDTLSALLETNLTILQSIATGIIENIPVLIDSATQVLDNIVTFIVNNLPMFINSAMQIIGALQEGFIVYLPTLLGYLPTIINSITSALLTMLPLLVETGVTLLTSLVENLPRIIEVIVEALPEIIDSIVNALTDMIPELVEAGVTLLTALVENLPAVLQAITGAMPQIITSIVNALTKLLPVIVSAGVNLFVALIRNLPQAITTIVNSLPKVISAIVTGIGDLLPQIWQAGKDLITGLWNGINDAKEWLKEKISGFFGGVLDSIKAFFGIKSPSKVFAGIGEMLDKGLAKGITDYADVAIKATENMAGDVLDAANQDYDFTATGNYDENGNPVGRFNAPIINVYGAEGQDVAELAEIVSERIAFVYSQEQAVWA